MKRLFALCICLVLPQAAMAFEGDDAPGIFFVADDLKLPIEVLNVWKASDPPLADVKVTLPNGEEMIVRDLSQPRLEALQDAFQNQRIERVLKYGPSSKPEWFDGAVTQMVEDSFVKQLTASYGGLTEERITDLRNYIAELAIDQIRNRARWGVPLVADPLIAGRVESGTLDITKPLVVERVVNYGDYSYYVTDQGRMGKPQYQAFIRAHDEWRVRDIFKRMNSDELAAQRAAVQIINSLPGLTKAVRIDCFSE